MKFPVIFLIGLTVFSASASLTTQEPPAVEDSYANGKVLEKVLNAFSDALKPSMSKIYNILLTHWTYTELMYVKNMAGSSKLNDVLRKLSEDSHYEEMVRQLDGEDALQMALYYMGEPTNDMQGSFSPLTPELEQRIQKTFDAIHEILPREQLKNLYERLMNEDPEFRKLVATVLSGSWQQVATEWYFSEELREEFQWMRNNGFEVVVKNLPPFVGQ